MSCLDKHCFHMTICIQRLVMWFVVQVSFSGYHHWHYICLIMIILWQFLMSCGTDIYNPIN
jgi:hypothetical protein